MIENEASGRFVLETSEVQLEIKNIIFNSVLNGDSEKDTKKKVKAVIDKYMAKVKDNKKEIEHSLAKSFVKWYKTFYRRAEGIKKLLMSNRLILGLMSPNERKRPLRALWNIPLRDKNISDTLGAPYILDEVHKHKKALEETLRKVAKDEALYGKGVSLRNVAEAQVRYEEIQNDIQKLKDRNVNLVWVSTHANCSARCAPYQGTLRSIKDEYGIRNNIRYRPLSEATDVIQTTKEGKRYKNGLLGFNCRHRLIPYQQGGKIPHDFTEKEMREQRKVDSKQRNMETRIRNIKKEAFCLRSVDYEKSQELFAKARDVTAQYRDYSHSKNRPAYLSRTRVYREEL